jgi:hypothetical protein
LGTNYTVETSPFLEEEFETYVITTTFNGQKCRITNIYRPPSGGSKVQFLQNIKTLQFPKDICHILVGDINIDALLPENSDVKKLFAS